MKSISDPARLQQIVDRLNALRADTPRLWGTMTPGEMLCHLSDASASVMDPGSGKRTRRRPFLKWIALSSPLAWPRGLKTPPSVDPHADGTKPADFGADRERAIDGLRRLASASAADLASSHMAFGPMTVRDWHRWAYRHTDHHLNQFGM